MAWLRFRPRPFGYEWNPRHRLARKARAIYMFDQGGGAGIGTRGQVADHSKAGCDLYVRNSSWWLLTELGVVYDPPGANSEAAAPVRQSLRLSGKAVTLVALVKWDAATTMVALSHATAASTVEYAVRQQNPGGIRGYINGTNATQATVFSNNVWYRIGMRYDGATIALYVNGNKQATTAALTAAISCAAGSILCAADLDNANTLPLNGKLAEGRVIEAAWTDRDFLDDAMDPWAPWYPVRRRAFRVAGVSAIAGTSAGAATCTGVLAGAGAAAGTSAGTSTCTGVLRGAGAVAGTSAGTAAAAGVLAGSGAVAGTSAGAATAVAALVGSGALSGAAAGSATTTGTLGGAGALAGSSAGTATVSGALDLPGEIQGAAAGAATCTGVLAAAGALAGAAAGAATCTASLAGIAPIAATASGTATTGAVLQGVAVLLGAVAGAGTASGSMTGAGRLVGAAAGAAGVTGRVVPTAAAPLVRLGGAGGVRAGASGGVRVGAAGGVRAGRQG